MSVDFDLLNKVASGKSFLYLDEQFDNPNSKVIISIAGINQNPGNNFDRKSYFASPVKNRPIVGFLSGAFQISGRNNYEAPLENALDKLNSLAKGANVIGQEFGSVLQQFGLNLGNIQFKNQLQTVLQWISSDRKSFSVPISFFAWNRGSSLIGIIRQLESATSPKSIGGSKSGSLSLITEAPGGYALNENGTATSGTCAVKIGQWFEADGLVLTNHSIQISETYLWNGQPFFAGGSINFEANMLLDAKKVSEWYKDPI